MIQLTEIKDNSQYELPLELMYSSPEVVDGITSGTGYPLQDRWYIHPAWHHCVFSLSEEGQEDEEIMGSIFFEIYALEMSAVVHLNFFPKFQYRKYTVPAGELFLEHMSTNYPRIRKLLGHIPDHNRKAILFAKHFNFKFQSAFITQNDIPYKIYSFMMEEYDERA